MSIRDIKQKGYLLIQETFFGEKCFVYIFILQLLIFIPITFGFRKNYNISSLYNLVNGDLFNTSSVLAGFVFTGLSFICTSDSTMINRLKETNNFITIKKYYIYSICAYIVVILMYLFKPIFVSDNIVKKQEVISKMYENIINVYLLTIIFIFVYACILFIFCLFILSKRLDE